MDVSTNPALLPDLAVQSAGPQGGASAPATGADFQSFLKLLTTQLRHQDPLQPLDSTQFVAQLASFSTVEQLVLVNDQLGAQAAQAEALSGAAYASWIGREASAVDGQFRAQGGPERFPVNALSGTASIEAVASTVDGIEIERFPVAPDSSGNATWRGADAAGVPHGAPLRIELIYHGAEAVIDRQPAQVSRMITGMRGTDEGVVFDLADGGTLSPADVSGLRSGETVP